MAGEVIGMNSQIYSQSGGYQGLSFSIPIDVAAKVARQLKDQGKVTRGWLGVVVQEVDRDMAQQDRKHTSELQSLMRISYAVFCLKKKIPQKTAQSITTRPQPLI